MSFKDSPSETPSEAATAWRTLVDALAKLVVQQLRRERQADRIRQPAKSGERPV